MHTKQQILDRVRALDDAVNHAAAKGITDIERDALTGRELVRQQPERQQLQTDCTATGGHVCTDPLEENCFLCGADLNAQAKQLSRNLSRG